MGKTSLISCFYWISISSQIFEIFKVANSLSAVTNPKFELPEELDKFYRDYIWNELQNPQEYSHLSLANNSNLERNELIDQVSHWIFPIGGIMHTVTSRTILFILNEQRVFYKIINELRSIDIDNYLDVHNAIYLHP